jgi:CRP/FNR family transcriptional regulator, cyclic AMP receptor protein
MADERPAPSKDFLRSIALFGGLEDASLERIQGMLIQHLFPPSAIVCAEGERGRSMYVVASGEVEVRRGNSNGAQIPIVRLGRGEFFGEMTLVEIQPRAATVVVTEPATLYAMTNRDLYALYLEDPNAYVLVLQNICRQLARRLRKADGQICELLSEKSVDAIHPSRDAVSPGPEH